MENVSNINLQKYFLSFIPHSVRFLLIHVKAKQQLCNKIRTNSDVHSLPSPHKALGKFHICLTLKSALFTLQLLIYSCIKDIFSRAILCKVKTNFIFPDVFNGFFQFFFPLSPQHTHPQVQVLLGIASFRFQPDYEISQTTRSDQKVKSQDTSNHLPFLKQ